MRGPPKSKFQWMNTLILPPVPHFVRMGARVCAQTDVKEQYKAAVFKFQTESVWNCPVHFCWNNALFYADVNKY